MANKRGYELATEHLSWDEDVFFNIDKTGFSRAKKYKAGVLKEHFKVGDQQYTDDNYVTDGETLTVSVDQLDIALKTLSDAVAALNFDNNGIVAAKISLTALQVDALGTTPFELLASPGASKAYQLIDIKWACYPTTTLDVGSQNLIIYVDGITNYLAIIRNNNIETPTTLVKGVQIQAEYELGIDKKIYCKFKDGTDPVSGSASMSFWFIYKVIDV